MNETHKSSGVMRSIIKRFIDRHEAIYERWMRDDSNIGINISAEINALQRIRDQYNGSNWYDLMGTCKWIRNFLPYFQILQRPTRYDANYADIYVLRRGVLEQVDKCSKTIALLEEAGRRKENRKKIKQQLNMMEETARFFDLHMKTRTP